MELKFAILADLVSETREGKLNILGIFDNVDGFEEPVIHPRCYLALRFEARVSEGNQHALRIGVYDADGQPAVPLSPDLPITFGSVGPGHPFRGQIIMEFTNLKLPRFGDYEFHVLIDGHLKATVPLTAKFSSKAQR